MRYILAWLFGLIALSLHSAIAIAEAQRIDEPDKYAGEIMVLLSNNDVVSVSKKISDTVGNAATIARLSGFCRSITVSLRKHLYAQFADATGAPDLLAGSKPNSQTRNL